MKIFAGHRSYSLLSIILAVLLLTSTLSQSNQVNASISILDEISSLPDPPEIDEILDNKESSDMCPDGQQLNDNFECQPDEEERVVTLSTRSEPNSPSVSYFIVTVKVVNDDGGNKKAGDFEYIIKSDDYISETYKGNANGAQHTFNPGSTVSAELQGLTSPSSIEIMNKDSNVDMSYHVDNQCTDILLKGGEKISCVITLDDKQNEDNESKPDEPLAPCPDGQQLSDNFECQPEGAEEEPEPVIPTSRVCPDGQQLNDNFECQPEGAEEEPEPVIPTSRVCPDGQQLNDNFECQPEGAEENNFFEIPGWPFDKPNLCDNGDILDYIMECLDNNSSLVVTVNVINDNGGNWNAEDFNYTLTGNIGPPKEVYKGNESGTVHLLNTGIVSAELQGLTSPSSIEIMNKDSNVDYELVKYDSCPAGSANPEEGCLLEGYQCGPDGCGVYSDGACDDCLTDMNYHVDNQCTDIKLQKDDRISCIITLDDQPAELEVIINVINDNYGDKISQDFKYIIESNNISPNEVFVGNESGTVHLLNPGTTSVKMRDGNTYFVELSQYDSYRIDNDCTNLFLRGGERVSCIITLDDEPAELSVLVDVVNDNGGDKTSEDFEYTIRGDDFNSNPYKGNEYDLIYEPGKSVSVNFKGVNYKPGSGMVVYLPSGSIYKGGDKCWNITLKPGHNQCRIIFNDLPAKLQVVFKVINDDGGNKKARDFLYEISSKTEPGYNTVFKGKEKSKSSFSFKEGRTHELNTGLVSVDVKGIKQVSPNLYSIDFHPDQGYLLKMKNCKDVVLKSGYTSTCVVTANDKKLKLFAEQKRIVDQGHMRAWVDVFTDGTIKTKTNIWTTHWAKGFTGAMTIGFLDEHGNLLKECCKLSKGVDPTGQEALERYTVLGQLKKVVSAPDADSDKWFKEKYRISKDIIDRTAKIDIYFKHDPKPFWKKYSNYLKFNWDNGCQPTFYIYIVPVNLCIQAGYNGDNFYANIDDVNIAYLSMKGIKFNGDVLRKMQGTYYEEFTIEKLGKKMGYDPQPFLNMFGLKKSLASLQVKADMGYQFKVNSYDFRDYRLEINAGLKVNSCLLNLNTNLLKSLQENRISKILNDLSTNRDKFLPKITDVLLKNEYNGIINELRDIRYSETKFIFLNKQTYPLVNDLLNILKDKNISYENAINRLSQDPKYQTEVYEKTLNILKNTNFKNLFNTIKKPSNSALTNILNPEYSKLINAFINPQYEALWELFTNENLNSLQNILSNGVNILFDQKCKEQFPTSKNKGNIKIILYIFKPPKSYTY